MKQYIIKFSLKIFLHLLGKYMQPIPQHWDQVSIKDWLPMRYRTSWTLGMLLVSLVFKREETQQWRKVQTPRFSSTLVYTSVQKAYLAEVSMS